MLKFFAKQNEKSLDGKFLGFSCKFHLIFWLIFILVFAADQAIKVLSLNGMRFYGEYFDLTFVLNRGVAFSMLHFLGDNLKFIHLILIVALFFYLFWQKTLLKEHLIAFAIMLSAGSSNLLDRFVFGGVVDMFFWHKWFEFAIFNFADVMINLSVILIIFKEIFLKKSLNKSKI